MRNLINSLSIEINLLFLLKRSCLFSFSKITFPFFGFLLTLLMSNFAYAQPENAIAAVGSGIFACSADATYTIINATPDLNAGSNWNNSGPKFNVWFKFVALATGRINIKVDRSGVKGGQRLTQLALWNATSKVDINSEPYTYNDVLEIRYS